MTWPPLILICSASKEAETEQEAEKSKNSKLVPSRAVLWPWGCSGLYLLIDQPGLPVLFCYCFLQNVYLLRDEGLVAPTDLHVQVFGRLAEFCSSVLGHYNLPLHWLVGGFLSLYRGALVFSWVCANTRVQKPGESVRANEGTLLPPSKVQDSAGVFHSWCIWNSVLDLGPWFRSSSNLLLCV